MASYYFNSTGRMVLKLPISGILCAASHGVFKGRDLVHLPLATSCVIMSGSSQGISPSSGNAFGHPGARPSSGGLAPGANPTASSMASSGSGVGVSREREPARLQRAAIERYIDKVATSYKLAAHLRGELHAYGDVSAYFCQICCLFSKPTISGCL